MADPRIPVEALELIEALMAPKRQIDTASILIDMSRDAMKIAILAKNMKLEKLGQLSTEQRDLIALGWLCSSLHTCEKNIAILNGGRNAVLNINTAVTAHNVPLPVVYEVQEQVVVNYLDGSGFGRKEGAKDALFTKNLDYSVNAEMRLHKIMRARDKVEDDDDEGEDTDFKNSFAKPVMKKKKVLN